MEAPVEPVRETGAAWLDPRFGTVGCCALVGALVLWTLVWVSLLAELPRLLWEEVVVEVLDAFVVSLLVVVNWDGVAVPALPDTALQA